jgi:hypothetical protein
MKFKILFLACLLIIPAALSRATSKTVTLSPVADSDVRWTTDPADSNYAKGDRPTLFINYVTSTNNEAKAYIRYQLPIDFGTASSATFSIVRVVMDSWDETYNVYGLKDSAAGNDWQDLSPGMYYGACEGGLTWNNAPANNKTSGNGFTSDATAVLGTFSTLGANDGGTNYGTYTVSTPDLVSFLNTDTDKNVTLMISRAGDSSSGADTSDHIRAQSQYCNDHAYAGCRCGCEVDHRSQRQRLCQRRSNDHLY